MNIVLKRGWTRKTGRLKKQRERVSVREREREGKRLTAHNGRRVVPAVKVYPSGTII